METKMQLKKISVEEMLLRPEQNYNPSIWKQQVNSMTKYGNLQFYVIEKGTNGFDYTQFFASYIVDGLYLFNKFSAFSASLTNNGFCKVSIDGAGRVHKHLFKDNTGKEGYAENSKKNRMLFAKNLTPQGIMVSNCI